MKRIAIAVCVLMAVTLAASAQTKPDPKKKKKKIVKAVVGKTAPDFTIKKLGAKKKTDIITLSKLAKDKPVLLVFGSYT